MKKRVLSLMLIICMMSSLIAAFPITVSAETSGTCGENLTWTLDDEGTLTISGTGDMTYCETWTQLWDRIKTVNILEGVTSIVEAAFWGMRIYPNIISITIPSSVTRIGEAAFLNCTSLTSIYVDVNNDCYSSQDGVLFNKNKTTIIQYPCGKARTAYIIPDSVTSIGYRAFIGCDILTSVTIPDGVTSIGDRAFEDCDSLTSVTIPDGVTSIGNSVFVHCESLTSVTIPNSVTSIGDYAFSNCHGLTSVTIPNSVTSIGESTFAACVSLTSVTIPNSVTSMGNSAFDSCYKLKSVTIQDGVTSIGNGAFARCESLTSVTIPKSVTSIGDTAFRFSDSLTDVYYSGSEQEWNNISIDYYFNDGLQNATIHYNYNCYEPINYEYLPPEEKSGQFGFASGNYDNGKAWGSYVYKDNYFKDNAYEQYNHDLARTSLDLAVSAFATKNIKTQYENAEAFLTKIGFVPESIQHNDWYEKEPEQNSIAVIAGRKHIIYPDGNYTLIAVAIRGQGYKSEWGGNFNVGTGENHAGFEMARDQVIEFVQDYVIDQRIGGNIKLWITGFSRAAATANLTAAYLDENPNAFGPLVTLTPDNIYAYCFETPAGTCASDRNAKLYDNIFSILNRHDPVPMVVMNRWNYGRYGITYYLPSAQTTKNYDKMATRMKLYYEDYANKSHYDYAIDDFASYELYFKTGYDWLLDYSIGIRETEVNRYPKNQGAFLDNVIINNLAAAAGNPYTYTDLYQADLVSFGENIIGKGKAKALGEDILKAIENKKSLYAAGGILSIGNPVIAFGTGFSAYYTMRGIIKDSLRKYNVTLSDETLGMLVEFLLSLSPEQLCTLLMNLEGLGQAHEPEICLAWMDTIDGSLLTSPNLRSFYINCPVNLEVYDSNDNLVAAVYDDIPQEIDGSSIVPYIDENGQKVVYLPQDEEYRIEVIATDDGEVTYSVQEQDVGDGSTKVINYNNMTVKKDDTLTGTAENLTTTETAVYALTSSTVEVAEAEIIEEAEPITVEVTSEGNGVTSNGGEYYKGEFAEIVATPSENEEFLGWYNGETLVSTDATYRFQVTEAIALTAKFTENTCEVIFLDDEDFVIDTVRLIKGNTLTTVPKAPAKKGYKFDGAYYTEDGTEVDKTTIFNEDTYLYAGYISPRSYDDYYVYWLGDKTVEFAGFRYDDYDELMVPVSIDEYEVVAISDYAFADMEYAKSVVIPDTVTKIGAYAFDNSSIEKIYYLGTKEDWDAIDIADNNEELENISIRFEYSDNIVSGVLENLQYSGYALTGTIYFDYVYKDCIAVVKVFNQNERLEKTSYVNVPRGAYKKYIGLPLTADDREHRIEITFVNNTEEMKEYGTCYYHVDNYFYAEKIRLYEGEFAYTIIDGNAEILGYEGTDTDIEIPENISGFTVTRIGDYAFAGYEDITSVIIPDTVTYIGECAFAATAIQTITIPASVTELGNGIFDCCVNLTEIIISEENENFVINEGHMYTKDMTKLIRYAITKEETEFVIPDTVTTIGSTAFSGSSITSVIIPESVKTIEQYAFSGCAIITVNIPASVETIDELALAYCENLTDIVVDEQNENYSSEDGVLFNKDKTVLIQYPEGKTSNSYIMPNSVVTIGWESFSNNMLQTISIPKTLKRVEPYAFYDCEMLETILYEGTEDDWWEIDFTAGNQILEMANIVFEYDGMDASIKSVFCWYDDNKVKASVDFDYIFKGGTMVLALYDSTEKLVDFAHIPVIPDGRATVGLDAQENYKDYTAKVMLWDGFATMSPLSKAFPTDIITDAILVDDVMESAHPYPDGIDETNVYAYEGECESIDVKFSANTVTEDGCDYIYIYDVNDNLIGRYSGQQLVGRTVNVPGNTVKIRLDTDGSVNYYGYRTEMIVVNK